MKHLHILVFATTLLLSVLQTPMVAQSNDKELDKQEQKRTIDSISVHLNAQYVFPDVALEMSQLLIDNYAKGKYDALENPNEFAEQLTEDLRSVSNDLHLRVMYAPERIAEQNNAVTDEDRAILEDRRLEQMKRNNFGFKEVKILDGNIGYLDLRGFLPTSYAGETATAAMNFLSNSDALIIDLRNNGGGSPSMIQLISSYLFEADPVHLNNFYYRPNDQNTQTWTLPYVPGTRRPDLDVYVLTSSNTFSAAEEFSYNLKNLERATLVGETTGGGAHPGGTMAVTDKFMVWTPTGRAINPITNTNWEGTGVKPHVEVPATQALTRAHIDALEKLNEEASDPAMVSFYEWYIKGMQAELDPVTLDEASMTSYVGSFGPRMISLENGQLYYQRDGRSKYRMMPMHEENWFMLDGLDFFRIEFVEENGEIVAVKGHYDNGRSDTSAKTP